MEEKEFYKNDHIRITSSRFIVETTTYAMSGVTSVKRGEEKKSVGLPVILVIIGVVTAIFYPINSVKLIGVALVVIAFFLMKFVKTEYSVFLNSSSGESQALTSNDKAYIDNVIHYLNEAIIYRG